MMYNFGQCLTKPLKKIVILKVEGKGIMPRIKNKSDKNSTNVIGDPMK